ncbi:MAG: enoyl-CoA hydratase/isomerase family protein, partial [Bacteroidetes bacterium]|nr:enoyl-CoA hydratase/isomerase family protein [Bacteroidota bacterium]
MAYQFLQIDLSHNILTISINREDKMNALNIALFAELKAVMQEVYDNPEIKGVIITGKGDKAFAAGADISEFTGFTREEGREMSEEGHAILNSIERSPKPVIAAVNGFALGGGCELAMACHMRIATENAKFGQPEVNLGIIPGYGGTQRLVHLVGKAKAIELLMTADMIGAQEAKELGLVNHVVSQGELIDKCCEILNKIFTQGPLAISKVIECANAALDETKNGFNLEIDQFASCFDSEDFKEGTTAFVEK